MNRSARRQQIHSVLQPALPLPQQSEAMLAAGHQHGLMMLQLGLESTRFCEQARGLVEIAAVRLDRAQRVQTLHQQLGLVGARSQVVRRTHGCFRRR